MLHIWIELIGITNHRKGAPTTTGLCLTVCCQYTFVLTILLHADIMKYSYIKKYFKTNLYFGGSNFLLFYGFMSLLLWLFQATITSSACMK